MASTKKTECAGFRILRDSFPNQNESLHLSACMGRKNHIVDHKHYCLIHAPTDRKATEFNIAVRKKLAAKDYNFLGAWFPEKADFGGVIFEGNVDFGLATFQGLAWFRDAKFMGGYADFKKTQFKNGSDFGGVEFGGTITVFNGAQFGGGEINFSIATFGSDAYFGEEVVFNGERGADFGGVHFEGSATFRSAKFIKGVDFGRAEFTGGYADFADAKFSGGNAKFTSAEFNISDGDIDFRRTEFRDGKADFFGTQFNSGNVHFGEAQFIEANANFADAHFGGGDVDFGGAHFGENACFSKAQFSVDANFRNVWFIGSVSCFNKARFCEDAYFEGVLFSGDSVSFDTADFGKTVFFRKATFKENIDFGCTIFRSQVFFDDAIFRPTAFVDFRLARFMDFVRFTRLEIEDNAEFYFGEAIFDKPNLVYFSDISDLQLRWFMNTDTRNFNYENVEFPVFRKNHPIPGELSNARELLVKISEIDGRAKEDVARPYKLLVTALRRMADNAEANSRYEYASTDRYMAFEVERLERIKERKEWFIELGNILSEKILCRPLWPSLKESGQKLRTWATFYQSGVPQFLYRSLSSYGESWWRALVILVLIWVVFAVLYLSPMTSFYRWDTKVSSPEEYQKALNENKIDNEGRKLLPGEAFTYSFAVMALQKPEPKPLGPLTNSLVLIETVFAPIQLALLALAIRRKFMR